MKISAPLKKREMTPEEKKEAVERFFSQKRESYFQLILANSIQTVGRKSSWPLSTDELKTIVDASLEAADYAIEKLFPLPTEENKPE